MSRCGFGIDLAQQMVSVWTDGFREPNAVLLLLGKSIIGKALTIPRKPVRGDLILSPARVYLGQHISCVMQRLSDDFEPIEMSHGRQDMSRVSSLTAARF